MTLPISYFRFYFPEYVLKTRLPPNCTTGFLDSLSPETENRLRAQAVEKVRWTFSTAFTMPRFSARAAGRKAAAARRKRLLTQAFCRHSIQHEGAPAPSYSPCNKGLFSFRQGFSTSYGNLRFPGPSLDGFRRLRAAVPCSRYAGTSGTEIPGVPLLPF